MEQFMKLPPGQKAAVLGAVLAVIGLGMYFLFVDPQLGRAAAAGASLRKIEHDLVELKAAASQQELERLRKKKDDLNEKNKEAKKMLPPAEEVPDLIDSIQRDAFQVGLQVRRFDRSTEEPADMCVAIPIKMVVEGKFLDLVRFFRIYSGNDRRVVHIRDLAIDQLPPDSEMIRRKLEEMRPSGTDDHGKTRDDEVLRTIQRTELENELVTVRATFTAYAYTWTGKPADAEHRSSRPRRRT